jgi:beta-glucanase (GH16 family)
MSKTKRIMVLICGIIIIIFSASIVYKNKEARAVKPQKNWTLVWNDEFNGENGSAVDNLKWIQEIGGNGWGNNEDQYYTDGTNNCYIQNENLVIEAKKEEYEKSKYTSARLKTNGKFDFKYGKVEMKAKLPSGQGIWPAFWMLGSDFETAGWPECGEIDIMENVGKTPKTVNGTAHAPGYSGNMGLGSFLTIEEDLSNAYHIYSIEWAEDKIEWFMDGKKYHSLTPQTIGGNKWAFNKEFFLLLNLAVGGNWPGYPNDTTIFPQKYYIDYVHVYQLR